MYYYNNELPPQQGWVCPKCGRVNAPWMSTCGCVSSQTSGIPYLVKIGSISRDSHEIANDESQTKSVGVPSAFMNIGVPFAFMDDEKFKAHCLNCQRDIIDTECLDCDGDKYFLAKE